MNTAARVGLFVLSLVAVFGIAAAGGNVVGPLDTEPGKAHGHEGMQETTAVADKAPGGLMVAENGYRLVLDDPELAASGSARISFRILGPDGAPLTAYAPLHERKLHFILAKRDLSGFQHLHPALADDGTWTVDAALTPGQWRVFADFDPAGKDAPITLGTDLTVPGALDPRPLPAPSGTATVDGYTVTMAGTVTPGEMSKVTLGVEKDGQPVTDLQPYLGAYGHLVALRQGDLAYLHVHPDGEPGDGRTKPGPRISFYVEAPSAGSYRLYLDFRHAGTVRTAEFTVTTEEHHDAH